MSTFSVQVCTFEGFVNQMKNSRELNNSKRFFFFSRLTAFKLVSMGLFCLFIGIADFLFGFWQETSLIRESALLFRSELAQLQIPTHHMVPNLNHEYRLTERPIAESLLPLNSSRRFRTNREGEIIDQEGIQEAPELGLKILFLGGSTTESNEVDEPFRFPTLVGKKLTEKIKHKVVGLNGGVRGHTTQESINLLLNHPTYQEAEVVVLMHNINDRLILSEKGTYKTDLSSLSPTSWLAVTKSAKDFIYNFGDFISYRSNLLFLFKRNFLQVNPWTGEKTGLIVDEQVLDYPDNQLDQSIKLFVKNLKVFISLAREGDQIPILMTQPLGNSSASQDKFNEAIRMVSKREDVKLIDLDKLILGDRQFLFYSDFIHFNNTGSIQLAKTITEHLLPVVSTFPFPSAHVGKTSQALTEKMSNCLPPPVDRSKVNPGPRHQLLSSYGRYPVLTADENYILYQAEINGHSRMQMYDRRKNLYIELSEISQPFDDRHPAIISEGGSGDINIIFGSTRLGLEKLFQFNINKRQAIQIPNIPEELATSIPTVGQAGEIIFAGYGQNADSKFDPVPDLFAINPNEEYRMVQITKTKWEEWRPVLDHKGEFIYHIANPKGDFDIYKIPINGGKSVEVYRSDKDEWDPDISKDGKWLVFASKQKGNFDLWLMNLANGKAPIQLTNENPDDWDPRFLPISHAIVFASGDEGVSVMHFLCPFGEG